MVMFANGGIYGGKAQDGLLSAFKVSEGLGAADFKNGANAVAWKSEYMNGDGYSIATVGEPAVKEITHALTQAGVIAEADIKIEKAWRPPGGWPIRENETHYIKIPASHVNLDRLHTLAAPTAPPKKKSGLNL